MKATYANLMLEAAAEPIRQLTLEATAEIVIEAAEAGKPAKRPTCEMLAYSGGPLAIGWGGPVYVDLAGLKAAENITLLLDHDRSKIVGQGTAEITARQCKVKGSLTGNCDDEACPAGVVAGHARNGFRWPVSIGASFDPDKIEEVKPKASAMCNGHRVEGPAIVVRAATLKEVSFVSIGGDSKASATVAAGAAKENTMPTFEQWLAAKGKDITTLGDAEKSKLQAAYDALKDAGLLEAAGATPPVKTPAPAEDKTPSPSELIASAATTERKRQAMIDRVCAGKHSELAAKASEEGWDEPRLKAMVEIEDLRAARPKSPAVGGGNGGGYDLTPKIMEAALCLKHSIGVDNAGQSLIASYGQETMDRADRARRLRPSDMFRTLYAQAGIRLPDEIGSLAYMRAAFSGSDIGSTILGNVANKALAAVIAEPTWLVPRLFGRASHANFHTHTVYSLAVNGDLEVVAPTGELQHMDLGKESWTRQLKTRGAMLTITRQDLIDDDLGAFTRMAQTFARKSMNTREKAGFTVIMATGAGSTHFTAARGNYLTGTGSALGATGLGNALKAFDGLTGPDGDPVNVEPAILLVPPTLRHTMMTLIAPNSNTIATGVTSSRVVESSANIYAGNFRDQALVGRYLEASGITGYSAAYWYLLANPGVLPCFEICYLNGQENPTVEFFGMDQNVEVLGVSWRVYWDFGVGTAEWRAGVKSAGA